jgi:hypothetical protein
MGAIVALRGIHAAGTWDAGKATPAELAHVDQVAELTGSKRTEVIKSALTVYHWFVRHR